MWLLVQHVDMVNDFAGCYDWPMNDVALCFP